MAQNNNLDFYYYDNNNNNRLIVIKMHQDMLCVPLSDFCLDSEDLVILDGVGQSESKKGRVVETCLCQPCSHVCIHIWTTRHKSICSMTCSVLHYTELHYYCISVWPSRATKIE